MTSAITVTTLVRAPIDRAWALWTEPVHICEWNAASPDWHTPQARNDLRPGGTFSSRMEARDGSMGFDFEGIYEKVVPCSLIAYAMADGRRVTVTFAVEGDGTRVTEVFDPETQNPVELQRAGWQAILDNFARFAVSL